MTTTTTKDETGIRSRLDEWIRASEAKDLDAIMANYMPNVRAFDAIGALQFNGAAAYRKHWEVCLSHMHGSMKFRMHDIDIATQGDLAFCHYLVNCGGTDADGQQCGGWTRATVCMRRVNGTWLIAHEHFSAPADPETGKALWELTPDDVAPSNAA